MPDAIYFSLYETLKARHLSVYQEAATFTDEKISAVYKDKSPFHKLVKIVRKKGKASSPKYLNVANEIRAYAADFNFLMSGNDLERTKKIDDNLNEVRRGNAPDLARTLLKFVIESEVEGYGSLIVQNQENEEKSKPLVVNDTANDSPAYVEALKRIKRENKNRTGILNLKGLKLHAFPAEISQLKWLRHIIFSGSLVNDLRPIFSLENLTHIDASYSAASSLEGVVHCKNLEWLSLAGTNVSDISYLDGLKSLHYLDCDSTRIKSLEGLNSCKALEELYVCNTKVRDLSPISECHHLRKLVISATKIGELAPLANLNRLEVFYCSRCEINTVDVGFWTNPSLKVVRFTPGILGYVPSEILSDRPKDNCLSRLREYFEQIRGEVASAPAKILLLGNGRVGKTQISRMLLGKDFQYDSEITHGVEMFPLVINGRDYAIWDFGGQSIFHSTHTIFLSSSSVYVLAWADKELNEEDQPLDYWVEFARIYGGNESPLILVQTHCDGPYSSRRRVPVHSVQLNEFSYIRRYSVDTCPPRLGCDALKAGIIEASQSIIENSGEILIPLSWKKLSSYIRSDEFLLTGQSANGRRVTIDIEEFRSICQNFGINDGYRSALAYLDKSGAVIYKYQDSISTIFVDFDYLLEGIYAVLQNDFINFVGANNGRFSQVDVAEKLWDQLNYSKKFQKELLIFLERCGICFHVESDSDVDQYILYKSLPSFGELTLSQRLSWQHGANSIKAEFVYHLIHEGVIGRIIADVGRMFRTDCHYWRHGIMVYHKATQCWLRVFYDKIAGWAGKIVIEVQVRSDKNLEHAKGHFKALFAIVEDAEAVSGIYAVSRSNVHKIAA